MDERDRVDQQSQTRQSTMKKDSRRKSKFASANSALAKARAFFRLFELKHHHREEEEEEQAPSTMTTIDLPSSSHEENQTKDLVLNSNLSIARISRVEKINSRDMIVHRVLDTDERLPSNYFQQKYKQYLKPSLLLPKQYYNELLNQRDYSTFLNRHDFYFHSPSSTSNSNFGTSCRQIKSLSDELCPPPSILRPSSSMLTWNQCVRRLNTEYRLTIDALEQAKECLKQIYSNSRYPANQNNEIIKTPTVTFSLPSSPLSPSIPIEQHKILPSVKFSKPKLIKPVQLETFVVPSELSIIENEEKFDSIANIIKKFNDLSRSSAPVHQQPKTSDSPINTPRVHFKSSVTTYEIPDLSLDCHEEGETTFTIETFYKNTDTNQNIVVMQEKTTEEQFNSVHQQNPTNFNSNTNSLPSTPLKKPNKSISYIPKRIPTSTATISRLKQPTKINSSPSRLKSPTGNSKTQVQTKKPPVGTTQQIHTPISSRSSLTNKRIPRPTVQRK